MVRFTTPRDHLRRPLDLADACAAPFERALTLLELARLRALKDLTKRSPQLLDEVRAICAPLKAQPTLDQVAALEAELDGPARRTHPSASHRANSRSCASLPRG